VRVPDDPSLPRLGRLLDPGAMRPVLELSLGRRARLGPPRIARVAYKPGVRAAVHYEVAVDGRAENAVAFARAGREPLLTWLPVDPGLPALAEEPRPLAARLARAGVAVPAHTVEPTIVPASYQPGARVVLRLGRHVLKAYGSERAYERGVAGLRLAAALPIRTPRLEACFGDLRLTVQSAVDGAAPAPAAAAATAGGLVRRLQAAPVAPTRCATPELLLALVAEKAALGASILPELGPRLARLVERLRRTVPLPSGLVLAHGDFDAEQLLDGAGGEPYVIDFDDVCVADPALDLATYLADVVVGGEDDLRTLGAVRGPLLAGYGPCPPALDWHLAAVVLARATHPFQRAAPDWSERVERIVRTAEELSAA
jgi:Phosphotransferase enzyme family